MGKPVTETTEIDDGRRCVSFIWEGTPPSSNRNSGKWGERLKAECAALYRGAGGTLSDSLRYGIVYWFVTGYSRSTNPDAGNISKRIWDGLEGAAYADDHVVRLQIAGIIDIGEVASADYSLEDIDMSGIPDSVLMRLLQLVEARPRSGFVYVETGSLKSSMFGMNLASRGGFR